jgi:fructokinase
MLKTKPSKEAPMTPPYYRLGIDLGGTKTESILLDPHGETVHRERRPTPRSKNPVAEYSGILNHVVAMIEETRTAAPAGAACTIGIGIPGTVHPQTGNVQNANTTSLIGKPFQGALESALGRPVAVENDANCFTLAEAREGAGKGYGLVFGVIMGTGCGGGLCIDGTIHRGQHRIAGEWGHVSVDPAGATCYCGNRGCVETKISGGGVEHHYQSVYGGTLTMKQILHGYRSGDDPCRSIVEQFIEDYGRCLGGLISILDPDAVILGGGLSNIDELYHAGLAKVRRYAFHDHIETPILKNQLGDSAGVFGAAWIGR